jgi:outer membrane protein TolC
LLIASALWLAADERNVVHAQEEAPAPRIQTAEMPNLPAPAGLTAFPTAEGKLYPINLPAALKLGNVRSLDIELAGQRLQVALAQKQAASVLWLPNLIGGADYDRHDGPIQTIEGPVIGTSRSGFMVGGAPYAVFSLAEALFQPLAVRQTVRARQAQVQAAANDTLQAVTQAYFNLLGGAAAAASFSLLALWQSSHRVWALCQHREISSFEEISSKARVLASSLILA